MRDMMVIVEPVIPRLRRYARALMRDAALADDLVQDCLERAITRWHQRRSDGDAQTWLFTILHNLASNQRRQWARRGPHVPIDEISQDGLASPAEQEAGLEQTAVLAALDRLPEDQRAVVLLISIEDLSYAEAARVLGVPVGTVMSRLSRARQRLREDLAGQVAPSAPPHLRRIK
uniref:RNA polymerase sigma factor n=1 Tax=uncultured Caulobacter sp. TaxID=158749 RepID=UPI0025E9DAB4|nr:sigma-70 family RNA polymerase sigma factor [uncultured Caulobacter sp.]